MGRIIKFRSWDKKEQCFITDYDDKYSIVHLHGDGGCQVIQMIQMILTCNCPPDMGCNGCIEIYEGDKLSFVIFDYQGGDKRYDGYVIHLGSGFSVWNKSNNRFCGDLDWVVDQDDELKVVGHKYEKSEGEK